VKVDSPVPVIDLTGESSPEPKKVKLSKEEIKKKKRSREKEKELQLSNKFVDERINIERDELNDSYQYSDQYYYDDEENSNKVEQVTEVDDGDSGVHDQPVVEEDTILDDTTVSSLTGKGNGNGDEQDQEEQEALMDRGVLTQLQQRRSPKKKRLTITQMRQMNIEKNKNK
jgi:hypothetical protein